MLEEQQGDWWNFRESHSDGFEYGDFGTPILGEALARECDALRSAAIFTHWDDCSFYVKAQPKMTVGGLGAAAFLASGVGPPTELPRRY
jgi:hypothetical protein